MEYLAGSVITFLGIGVLYLIFNKTNKDSDTRVMLKASQSYNHKLFAPLILNITDRRPVDCQSIRHYESNKTRILFTDKNAYWIRDNKVLCADLDPMTGLILEESTKEVDMMGMDKVQLDEMMFIVEQLTEGQSNDSWRSRDS